MTDRIEREDVTLAVEDGQPVLRIDDIALHLTTRFEGAPPESVELDSFDQAGYFILDFDEEYFDGLVEITPEYEVYADAE